MKNKFEGYELEINTWEEIELGLRRVVENQGLLALVVSVILIPHKLWSLSS